MSKKIQTEDFREGQLVELTTKYLLLPNGSTLNVIDLGVNARGAHEFVEVSSIITLKNYEIYETKRDVMYHKLIRELKSGSSINNYKSSKYYNYYLKRLKKDNPEYLI